MDQYEIKIGEVLGPLDLILSLIEKKKLHISDVSLAQITDGYLAYIENLEKFPVKDTANFITVASTLILIKSISLLPDLKITEEEQTSVDELNERLRLYKENKDRSIFVEKLFGKKIIFLGGLKRNNNVIFKPTSEIDLSSMLQLVKDILLNLPKKEILSTAVVKKIISLEEAIDNLISRIKIDLKTSWSKLRTSTSDGGDARVLKFNVIVNFLAMLELVKRGMIIVNQETHFKDMDIESQSIGAPIYN